MTLDEKLFTVKITADEISHLNPDNNKCLTCKDKPCTFVCPAKVYEWEENEKKLVVNFENCLECGACRITCSKGAIEWAYPRGNKGVTFKNG